MYNAAKKEFGDAQVVKTTWLIHSFGFNEELAREIMQNGFSNGLSKDDLNQQTMTWANGKHEDKGYSYNIKRFQISGKFFLEFFFLYTLLII